MIVDQLGDLKRGGHFPRDGRAGDDTGRERFRHLRHGHADRLGTEAGEQVVDDTRATADLHALEVLELVDRVLGVEEAWAVGVDAEELDAGELVHRIGFDEFVERDGGRLALGDHEGQLEHFRFGEAAGRVAEHGPDQIDDAVLGLVVEVGRRAAELHGRIELELQPAARGVRHALHPRLDGLGGDRRLRGQHLVHAQGCHILCPDDGGGSKGCSAGGGTGKECTSLHSFLPMVGLTAGDGRRQERARARVRTSPARETARWRETRRAARSARSPKRGRA